jgi:hypothetical protein
MLLRSWTRTVLLESTCQYLVLGELPPSNVTNQNSAGHHRTAVNMLFSRNTSYVSQ